MGSMNCFSLVKELVFLLVTLIQRSESLLHRSNAGIYQIESLLYYYYYIIICVSILQIIAIAFIDIFICAPVTQNISELTFFAISMCNNAIMRAFQCRNFKYVLIISKVSIQP